MLVSMMNAAGVGTMSEALQFGPRSNERSISEDDIVLTCEIRSRRDGNAVAEHSSQSVVQDHAIFADFISVAVSEPCTGPDGNTNPI